MRVSNASNIYSYTSTNRNKSKKIVLESNESVKVELSQTGIYKSSLPKELVNKIKEFAKDGAKKGDYMTPEYRNFIKSYMKENISPDRTALMAKASFLIPKTTDPKNALDSFLKYYGLKDIDAVEILLNGESYSASRKLKYVSIKDEYGNEVLSWDINNGWLSHSSKKEQIFYSSVTNIYAMAYDEERARMRANGELND